MPCPLVTGAPLDDPTNEALDSTFGDGLNLYEGQYFSNKKELNNKLTEIALKGNFEFRTRKSNSWLWVIERVDSSCSWRVRASKISPDSIYFVIHKYVGVHSCPLLSRNSNHHQATYDVVGSNMFVARRASLPKVYRLFFAQILIHKSVITKLGRGDDMLRVLSKVH